MRRWGALAGLMVCCPVAAAADDPARESAATRPYRALGYPVVPALYATGAVALVGVLVVYRPETTWPRLALVLLGVPVYVLWTPRD